MLRQVLQFGYPRIGTDRVGKIDCLNMTGPSQDREDSIATIDLVLTTIPAAPLLLTRFARSFATLLASSISWLG